MTQHLWITAPQHRDREAAIAPLDLPPLLGRVDAHRRRRGPYSAAGELLQALVPGLLATRPGLVRRHDIELLTAAPELAAILTCERSSLTWTSDAEERTRFYPRAQTTRVGHGLTELLAACGDGRALVIENLHEADPTDAELVAIMLRRVDPEVLRLVITSRDEAPEHALEVHAPATRAPAGARSAAAYVAADCTSDEPAQIAAYEALEPAERAALHDARAHELEGRDEASAARARSRSIASTAAIRAGRVPRRCPPPSSTACCSASTTPCSTSARARWRCSTAEDPKACWLVVAKVTTALTALGRPDEAAELYDDACAATADPVCTSKPPTGARCSSRASTRASARPPDRQAPHQHGDRPRVPDARVGGARVQPDVPGERPGADRDAPGRRRAGAPARDRRPAPVGRGARARHPDSPALGAALQPCPAAGADGAARSGAARVQRGDRGRPAPLGVLLRARRGPAQARARRGGPAGLQRGDPAQPAVSRGVLQPRGPAARARAGRGGARRLQLRAELDPNSSTPTSTARRLCWTSASFTPRGATRTPACAWIRSSRTWTACARW